MIAALIAGSMLVIGACGGDGGGDTAAGPDGPGGLGAAAACPTDGEPIEDARIYIEHNATDEDTGIHGSIGADGWSSLCVRDPSGAVILVAQPLGRLGSLGVADLFFESREPENDEYSIESLLEDFPEGEYTVGIVGHDGTDLAGSARFTHDIPAPPVITSPELAEDEEDASEATAGPAGLVVRWDPVVATITGDPIVVTGYEVILTALVHEDPDGLSLPEYDVHVGPGVHALQVPEAFLMAGTAYELEVLALEASGNQTISLGFFATP
jgi:hypothetical protein